MKTILVTGAAGYIGRHVVKNALDRGYRVIAADFNFKGVDERAEFCDVPLFGGDADLYRKLGSPDVCIHLAWRDGFRHNSAAHMKDLSSHVTFLNTLIDGGLKDLSVMRSAIGRVLSMRARPASRRASTALPRTPCARA